MPAWLPLAETGRISRTGPGAKHSANAVCRSRRTPSHHRPDSHHGSEGEDAEERKVSALPFLLFILLLGSVGPLLYLIRRFGDRTKHDASLAPQGLRN
jgi:hypothetical protein